MRSFRLSALKILSLLIAMTTLCVQAKSDLSTTGTSDVATPGLHDSFINIGDTDENRSCHTGCHRCCGSCDSDELFVNTLTYDFLQAAVQNSGENMMRRLLLPMTLLANKETNIDNAITDFSVTQNSENTNLFEITGFIQSDDDLAGGTGSAQIHIKATIEITPDNKIKKFSLKSTGEDQQKNITLTVNMMIDKNEASPDIEQYSTPTVVK